MKTSICWPSKSGTLPFTLVGQRAIHTATAVIETVALFTSAPVTVPFKVELPGTDRAATRQRERAGGVEGGARRGFVKPPFPVMFPLALPC